jgi:hypothetical protein
LPQPDGPSRAKKRQVVDGDDVVEALGDAIEPNVWRAGWLRRLPNRFLGAFLDGHQRAAASSDPPSAILAPQS